MMRTARLFIFLVVLGASSSLSFVVKGSATLEATAPQGSANIVAGAAKAVNSMKNAKIEILEKIAKAKQAQLDAINKKKEALENWYKPRQYVPTFTEENKPTNDLPENLLTFWMTRKMPKQPAAFYDIRQRPFGGLFSTIGSRIDEFLQDPLGLNEAFDNQANFPYFFYPQPEVADSLAHVVYLPAPMPGAFCGQSAGNPVHPVAIESLPFDPSRPETEEQYYFSTPQLLPCITKLPEGAHELDADTPNWPIVNDYKTSTGSSVPQAQSTASLDQPKLPTTPMTKDIPLPSSEQGQTPSENEVPSILLPIVV